ncbi:uncharacterized protein BP5553_08141 [Venustampulla echinocandica]|uniref:Uncharacterized protein n=1 Tax=Venustampulla echinocandica TaxID=2656787 RepID=A0A370TFV6_9HELO|nr:uncharacterized protein BP5553_08141 [Venustampulla echinocandica]RDL33773.1 hypothetical protein BP5553_08141 [Venustampulla echinocandica]
MSNLPVETAEPEPAATSIGNDQVVNKEGGDASAPTEVAAAKTETETEKSNGAHETEKVEKTEQSGKTGEDTQANEQRNSDGSPKTKGGESNGRSNNKRENNDRPFQKRENHSKYDPSILPADSDPKLIRAQVEFYFGDANLPTDKFMWEQTDGTENKPIPVKDICKFGRMKRFTSEREVVAALKESAFLVVSGEEGEETVKRKIPYDPTFPRSRVESRSVYAKGFGEEEPSSQFDIEALFAPYGPTNAVRLRRADDKLFKGSVFVEFQDDETAEKFLALDPKPLWKGKELSFMSKRDYVAQKTKDIKDGKIQPKESWAPRPFRGGSNNVRGRGGNRGKNDRDHGRDRGDRDPNDWKKRREDDQASGFKDRRNGNGRDRDNKNRRGRRGDRNDRGPQDRNRERNGDGNETKTEEVESKEAPANAAKTAESTSNDKKRAREDDGAAEAPSPKKVDVKADVSAEV